MLTPVTTPIRRIAAVLALCAAGWLSGPVLAQAQDDAAPPRARAPLTPEQAAAREKTLQAQSDLWNKVPAPADPRDFSGVWWTRGHVPAFRQLDNSLPPMTPLEAASHQKHLDMEKAGTPIGEAQNLCMPAGVPHLLVSPYPIQFDYSAGQILILYEVQHNVRFVHMDGKPVPPRTPRTFLGYSRGHWEGDELVIVTDHFNDQTQIDEESLSHGLKLVVTERISKFRNKYGGAELRDRITIEDPDHYTRPWTTERLFPWRSDVQLAEYSCEENNHEAVVNGVLVPR